MQNLQRPLRPHVTLVGALFSVWLVACGAGTPAADVPVPPSEPRETARLLIDLPKTASCTETFDLAVYENRNIELIAWKDDDGGDRASDTSPDCEHRIAEVRYLSKHISKSDVLSLLRSHATRVTETTKKGP